MLEKPTQKALDNLLERLSIFRKRRDQVAALRKYAAGDHWGELKALLTNMADTDDKAVRTFSEARHLEQHDRIRMMDEHAIQRDAYLYVVELVDKPEDEIKKLDEHMAVLENQIAQKRQELKDFGPEPVVAE